MKDRTRLALPLGLITLAVYLAVLPWTTRVWLRNGDEPHYLVATHSLAYDGDFDLRNNYDPNIFQAWYTVPDLGRQVNTQADGSQFLVHTYGLPILLAPAYRLFGLAGISYFLAALGALLAANVYLLGYQVTRDWRASAVGWFAVAFAPPLVWYVFLIYPELAGALCVTLAVRMLLKDPQIAPRSWSDWLIFGLSLGALPWLSARFIPAMLTLALLAAWLLWRERRDAAIVKDKPDQPARLRFAFMALALAGLSLAGFTLFNALLYGDPSPAASYAGSIARPNTSWYTLLQLARGLVGWLMDQQRGLLVTAPLYFLPLVGLWQWLRHRGRGAVVIGATFGAAWFSLSLLGGFWIGVEPAARYLVHVLPPLGAALAYAWAHRRGPWLAMLTATGSVISLAIALLVFRNPLLAQTEAVIGKRAPQLAQYLPALGRNIYLSPMAEGTIAEASDDGTLLAPAGIGGILFQQNAIPDFSFGWYDARVQLAATQAPQQEPVARVVIQGGDNSRLLQVILKGSDFQTDGGLQTFTFPIYNPVYNQWEKPGAMWVFSTGKAELRLGTITLLPASFNSLILPLLWLAGLGLIGLVLGAQYQPQIEGRGPEPAWLSSLAVLAGAAALVGGAAWWSARPLARAYAVSDLRSFVGAYEPAADASAGEALVAHPELGDSSGVLASTRAQFYPPGRLVWRLRLKAGSLPPDSAAENAIALAHVFSARQPVSVEQLEIFLRDVPADGQFHTIEFAFDNPIEQALVFELKYTAYAQLATDRFEVLPGKPGP